MRPSEVRYSAPSDADEVTAVSRRSRSTEIAPDLRPARPAATADSNIHRQLGRSERGDWWSQSGSNRRPLPCHGSALPAELWPHSERRETTHPPGYCQA